MLTFRQKLFLSYLIVFLIFLALLFPFAAQAVRRVVNTSLADRTTQVIDKIESADTVEAMVEQLRTSAPNFFFRVTLFDPGGFILYDSHLSPSPQLNDVRRYLNEHPEIAQALEKGVGYHEGYSHALGQSLVYVAKSFSFHGKTFVVRTAYPLSQVNELTEEFEFGFFALGFTVLLLFGVMTSAIAHQLSRPIRTIINAIKPYQEGKQEYLPEIILNKGGSRPRDEFARLAETLNSLNRRIQSQIDTLRSERNEKEAVLEALVEGVIAVDSEMIVTYANAMALQMIGWRKEDLLQHVFTVTQLEEFQDLLQGCQQQGEMLAIASELGEGKSKIYVDAIAAPKANNTGAVLVLQDKSIHYRILEMRKDFIANASHELKTPITIISGFAETMHENPQMPTEMMQEVTAKILANCHRMDSLIKNLLRLADIENLPRGNLRTVNVYDLVDGCRMTTLSVYPDAQIEVLQKGHEDMKILADPDLLELAVNNLMQNGAKYSKGAAKLSVVIEPAPNHMVSIAVTDRGIGIPSEDLPYIFDRFYTVDKAHSRRLGGSGLGLSIVRTIVEKHFGKVSVTSEVGKGSTFVITLPLKPGI
ncbi:MAG: PAS domain-containing protein [Verrucomicrobia bacterium]|nr:PAS domain-containing protein [Verrucomicrobiota bacterium]